MSKKSTNFSKILVGIDNSSYSEKALTRGIALSEKINSALILVTVIDTRISDFWDNSEYVGIVSDYLKKTRLQTKNNLLKKIKKIDQRKIKISMKILEGDVADELIKFSKKENVDLIILGSKGYGKIKKMFLGSVSSKVSEQAPCSVLIVK